MEYYRYKKQVRLKAWGMFKDLQGALETLQVQKEKKAYVSCNYEHVSEILNAHPEGMDSFNLKAYCITCEKIAKKTKSKLDSMTDYIVDDTTADFGDQRLGRGEVGLSKLKSREEAFDMIENSLVFRQSLDNLYNIRDEYISTKGVDPVTLVINALRGVPEAIQSITSLDEEAKDLVVGLCEVGNGSLLQRLEALN